MTKYTFFISVPHSPRRDLEKEIMIFYVLLLRWLRRDSDKKKNYFATTLTAPWLWQIIILFFIPTLLSLHNYHQDKLCFATAATFTSPWSRQKINLFSFQHYFLYTVVMRIKLLYNYHEKKNCSIFSLRKLSGSKRSIYDTAV